MGLVVRGGREVENRNDRLRVFPPPQSLNSVACLRVAVAAVAALVLDLAFAVAPALAHSVAFGSGTRSCVGLVDCLGFRNSRTAVDHGSSRLSGWRSALRLRSIAAETARSNFRSCLAVSDHGSCRQSRWTIALRLHWIAVAGVAGFDFDFHSCRTASDRGSSHRLVSTKAHHRRHSIAAVAVVDSDLVPSW